MKDAMNDHHYFDVSPTYIAAAMTPMNAAPNLWKELSAIVDQLARIILSNVRIVER
jgi:hypothetical protein